MIAGYFLLGREGSEIHQEEELLLGPDLIK
jgi:hypothetical protein